MASKSNNTRKFGEITKAMNPTDNALAAKFFSKNVPSKPTGKDLKNKVEDRKVTQQHKRQKH